MWSNGCCFATTEKSMNTLGACGGVQHLALGHLDLSKTDWQCGISLQKNVLCMIQDTIGTFWWSICSPFHHQFLHFVVQFSPLSTMHSPQAHHQVQHTYAQHTVMVSKKRKEKQEENLKKRVGFADEEFKPLSLKCQQLAKEAAAVALKAGEVKNEEAARS